MPIVWEMPDGSLMITQIAEKYLNQNTLEGESKEDAVTRLAGVIRAKTPVLRLAGPPNLVKTADIPKERSERDRWRLRDGKVIPDPNVPLPVREKTLLERIEELEAKNAK